MYRRTKTNYLKKFIKGIKMLENILILSVIVIIKAIFTAGETAFTLLSSAKISQESKKSRKAKKMKEHKSNTNKFYGVIEVRNYPCRTYS